MIFLRSSFRAGQSLGSQFAKAGTRGNSDFVAVAFVLLACTSCSGSTNETDVTIQPDSEQPQCIVDQDCPTDSTCKTGHCSDGMCSYETVEGVCDDGDPCTVNDSCFEGSCLGTTKECSNGLWCDGPESCNPKNGECLPGQVPSEDDRVACTVETCDEESKRILHVPDDVGCEDLDACSKDLCDTAIGCVHLVDDGAECDDGNKCTEADSCSVSGKCQGMPKQCGDNLFCNGSASCEPATGKCDAAETPLELSDGIDCTTDSCDEENDQVLHTPDDALCQDNNQCTTEVCSIDMGGCKTTLHFNQCDDGNLCTVDDTCVAGSCTGSPKKCDDQLYCNGPETCNASNGECIPAGKLAISDGIECTVDECDEENDTITHTPDDFICDDNDPCTVDSCSLESGCTSFAEDCTGPCFYSTACMTASGDSCLDPIPLNYGQPPEAEDPPFVLEATLADRPEVLGTWCDLPDKLLPTVWYGLSVPQEMLLRFVIEPHQATVPSDWTVGIMNADCMPLDPAVCWTGTEIGLDEQRIWQPGDYLIAIRGEAVGFTLTLIIPE